MVFALITQIIKYEKDDLLPNAVHFFRRFIM